MIKSAEVYDVVRNSWKNLPDMPEVGYCITCVALKNHILISSEQFRLISYDVDNQAYSYVGLQNDDEVDRILVSSREKLYLFEHTKIFEMTRQYEVLDTITTKNGPGLCYQKFTNKEGMTFLLLSSGKVCFFDPFGEKKLTTIKDLQQD